MQPFFSGEHAKFLQQREDDNHDIEDLAKIKIIKSGNNVSANDLKEVSMNLLHPDESYGIVLYDFCHYRSCLKTFHKKHLWIRRVHSLGKLAYDIAKAYRKDTEMPLTQEFYREHNMKKY